MSELNLCDYCNAERKVVHSEESADTMEIAINSPVLIITNYYQAYAGAKVEGNSIGFNINNCPMCGRKLVGSC
ncbi:hypothetical protein BSL90_07100 [Listeria monocytogenes]|nr:hypothetical protein [Listeria monocytogenes]EAG7074021.1 hypothetical protein [Listeria monocytogenes]EAK8400063.1 hypothetical protein [Listeria monocytogenes]MBC6362264.1 hypothetical protein [Listeria monocytogenes]